MVETLSPEQLDILPTTAVPVPVAAIEGDSHADIAAAAATPLGPGDESREGALDEDLELQRELQREDFLDKVTGDAVPDPDREIGKGQLSGKRSACAVYFNTSLLSIGTRSANVAAIDSINSSCVLL